MSLKDDICRHGAPMQPPQVICQCADPSGVSQPHRVGIMLELSTGELLVRAGFIHHDDHAIVHMSTLCRT